MPKSLQSYITDVASKPRKKPEVVVPEPTPEIVAENKSTSLKDYINTIAEQKVYKAPPVVEEIAEEVIEEVVKETPVLTVVEGVAKETKIPAVPVITEAAEVPSYIEKLTESIFELRQALVEQQNTQVLLGDLLTNLVNSVQTQTALVESRFEGVDTVLSQTSQLLAEATEKLQALTIRDITVPAPIVNVSLSEQKKIIKTVDRDSNGLISKITEETEQSVVGDK